LTAIVNAVAGNGTVAHITAMVTQGVLTLGGAANIGDLVALINRNAGQNTPNRVTALLTALGAGQRVRFNAIVGKLGWFTRAAVPNHPTRYYDAAGAVCAAAAAVYTCDAWAHFYRRHTYECCNFAGGDVQNTMYVQAVDLLAELDGDMATAIGNGLNAAGANAANGLTNRIGVAGAGGVIAQMYPLAGNIDDTFPLAVFNAIGNLR
jgi:hypothetical protein